MFTLDVPTLTSGIAYLVIVAGFIFRLEGKVRLLTEKLDSLEDSHRKNVDELIPTIHKVEAKLDLISSLFLQNSQKEV